jgi:hypothetical protein
MLSFSLYLTVCSMGGIFHVPSTISFFGQYKRMTTLNESAGAGSQFDSLSLPGESCWIYRVSEPSPLNLSLSRSPIA